MRRVSIYSIAALTSLDAFPSTALAGNAPGPQEVLSVALILASTMVFTFAGGGYAVLASLKKAKKAGALKRRLKFFLSMAGLIVAGLFVMSSVVVAVAAAIAAGIYAIVRGGNMFCWGVKALKAGRPGYLSTARPARLIASGSLLIICTVVLAGIVFFYGSVNVRKGVVSEKTFSSATNAQN